MQLQNHKSVKNGFTLTSNLRKGFTLIELMIVIAIMGILFSIGFLNSQDYSRQQALLAVARTTQSDLRLAQELAAAGNKPPDCDNTYVLNGYQYRWVTATSYVIRAYCSGPSGIIVPINKTVNLPSGYTIAQPPASIIFKSLGQGTDIPAGTSKTIVITQTVTGNTKTITIGANGNVE